MGRIRVAQNYDESALEIERPQPLSDNRIESLTMNLLSGLGKLDSDITDQVYVDFKKEMPQWISQSKLNKLHGLESFFRIDICNGCTQFIDNIYINQHPQILKGDYKYHERLNQYIQYIEVGNLVPLIPLIVAMPFPAIGKPHKHMTELLDECLDKHIPVHIDGAWITCSRDLNFDLSHPAIQSFAVSLSKGLGLGWNRIALRWSKAVTADSISIMNDFHMNNRALVKIGLHFIRNLPSDYLWEIHGNNYYKVCKDFNLTPTNSIHLALRDGNPVGVSPLLRYLENNV